MSRCRCCNLPLKSGEWNKKTPDGKENDVCNICVSASVDDSPTYKDPQLVAITDQLFVSMGWSRYVE